MSLYNLLFGVNDLAVPLMAMLQLEADSIGRFRDCYLQRHPLGHLEIHLHTRNGGGNRPDFEDVTAKLREHPLYVRDFDEEADTTYATYVFAVPPEHLEEVIAAAAEPGAIPPPLKERFAAVEQRLKEARTAAPPEEPPELSADQIGARMKTASDIFYSQARALLFEHCQDFTQLTGLISSYATLCKDLAQQKLAFGYGERVPPNAIKAHRIVYLFEKFDRLFGPMIHGCDSASIGQAYYGLIRAVHAERDRLDEIAIGKAPSDEPA